MVEPRLAPATCTTPRCRPGAGCQRFEPSRFWERAGAEKSMLKGHPMAARASVKNEEQDEALKDKGMSKPRAARIANVPKSSSPGGQKRGSGERQAGGSPRVEAGSRPARAGRRPPRGPERRSLGREPGATSRCLGAEL
jgi:hypothetical protein